MVHLPAGTLPSSLATSASATTLDISSNHLTALPLEWSDGFVNSTRSSFETIFVQHNQIQVGILLGIVLLCRAIQDVFCGLSDTQPAMTVSRVSVPASLVLSAKQPMLTILWHLQSPFPAALATLPRLLFFEASDNRLR